MYKARYYRTDGTEAEGRDLPIWLFDGIVNEHVLHQAVRAYLLNQRQGSASAKTRSEVRGGGRKPWRQKGTGRARHGTIRSPIWAGGGIVFAPKPKSWRVDLPKKVKRLAKRSALNARADEDRVLLIDELDFEQPRTKRLRGILDGIATEGKILLLTRGVKEEVYLSGRNIPHVKVMPFGDESAYDVLWASTILIEQTALEAATEEAEAAGLVEKAERRIARAEAKAEEATTEEAETEVAAAPEVETEAAPAEAEEEEAVEEGGRSAGEEAEESADEPEAGERQTSAEKLDAETVEIPTVKELDDFLADFGNVEAVRALQERDDRKTAQKHYEERIAELAGETEEEDDG